MDLWIQFKASNCRLPFLIILEDDYWRVDAFRKSDVLEEENENLEGRKISERETLSFLKKTNNLQFFQMREIL